MIRQEAAWAALRSRQELETRRLRRAFRARALEVLGGCLEPDGTLTNPGRVRFTRLMAPVYDEYYGAYRGDESALFYRLTVRHAREGRRLAAAVERSLIADIVGGRVDLPFDRNGRPRGQPQ